MFKELVKTEASYFSVFKSASLSFDGDKGALLVVLAESSPRGVFFLKVYSACQATHGLSCAQRHKEGVFIQDRVDALERYEQLITELEYSELAIRMDDSDDGQSFLCGAPVSDTRPGRMVKATFEQTSLGGNTVFQLIRGGVRAIVVQDVALGLQAYQISDGAPKRLNLDPGIRTYLEEALNRAGIVSAALEVWLNRSSVYITDIAFRTVREDFTSGSFVFRQKAIARKLPASFFQGAFSSHFVLPQKFTAKALQALNPNNIASPVMYVRNSSELPRGPKQNDYRYILDYQPARDAVIMQAESNRIGCIDVERDELFDFASPSQGLSGSIYISGLRADSRIRPAVF